MGALEGIPIDFHPHAKRFESQIAIRYHEQSPRNDGTCILQGPPLGYDQTQLVTGQVHEKQGARRPDYHREHPRGKITEKPRKHDFLLFEL